MKQLRLLLILLLAATTISAQRIVRQSFENGMDGWQAVSMNTNNNSEFGIKDETNAYKGDKYFQFSSYYSAADYNQYLISPVLNLTEQATLSFYVKDIEGRGEEALKVMASTTDSQISSFSDIARTINATSSWQLYTITLPANTRYVAFHYVSEYEYYLGIDYISVTQIAQSPEVELDEIHLPDEATAGMLFTIGGLVRNNSTTVLTYLEVSYTINGTTFNDTLQNMALDSGDTLSFVHGIPATVHTEGKAGVTLSVSKPNNVDDVVSDNTVTDSLLICGVVSELPYTQGFENGMKCWSGIAATNDNSGSFGIGNPYGSAHTGSKYFQFSSWYSSSDYSQYLISPELTLTVPAELTFFAKDMYGNGQETFDVMISATTDDITSFTTLSSNTARGSWSDYHFVIPAGTKYVMIKYTAINQYIMGIDDIELTVAPNTPEIELISMRAPFAVGAGVDFVVKGTVINHNVTPVTRLTARCIIGNDTTTETISGLNIPFEQQATFAMQTPIAISNVGNTVVKLMAVLPNDTADVEDDNMLTFTTNAYDTTNTVPRNILMEQFSTASCPNCMDGHRRIDAAMENGDFWDDVIWVTHHSGYHTDRLTTDVDETMLCFFNDRGSTYAPAVMMDRTNMAHLDCTRSIGTPPGPVFFPYNNLEDAIEYTMQQPAYVTVGVSALNYDSQTRQLTATVSGKVMPQLNASDLRLNVWLMEDSLIADGATTPGHGPTQSYGDPATFRHNHVIRELLSTDHWGDNNVVTNNANATYTKSYSCTVSQNYIDEHCYLVAFVCEGNHTDVNNCKVFNSAKSWFITDTMPVDTTMHDTMPEPPHHKECNITATYQGAELSEGDTISVTVDRNEMADVFVGYGNKSKSDITVRIFRNQETTIDEQFEGFCVNATCYGGDSSGDITIAGNSSVDEPDHNRALHISFSSASSGNAITRYWFENMADTADRLTFYILYNVTADSIPEGMEDAATEGITVYPNPASDVIMVEGIELSGAPFVIYSLSGQQVAEGTTNGVVAIGSLPASTYILEIKENGRCHRFKILVR